MRPRDAAPSERRAFPSPRESDEIEMADAVAPMFDMGERDCPIDDGARDER